MLLWKSKQQTEETTPKESRSPSSKHGEDLSTYASGICNELDPFKDFMSPTKPLNKMPSRCKQTSKSSSKSKSKSRSTSSTPRKKCFLRSGSLLRKQKSLEPIVHDSSKIIDVSKPRSTSTEEESSDEETTEESSESEETDSKETTTNAPVSNRPRTRPYSYGGATYTVPVGQSNRTAQQYGSLRAPGSTQHAGATNPNMATQFAHAVYGPGGATYQQQPLPGGAYQQQYAGGMQQQQYPAGGYPGNYSQQRPLPNYSQGTTYGNGAYYQPSMSGAQQYRQSASFCSPSNVPPRRDEYLTERVQDFVDRRRAEQSRGAYDTTPSSERRRDIRSQAGPSSSDRRSPRERSRRQYVYADDYPSTPRSRQSMFNDYPDAHRRREPANNNYLREHTYDRRERRSHRQRSPEADDYSYPSNRDRRFDPREEPRCSRRRASESGWHRDTDTGIQSDLDQYLRELNYKFSGFTEGIRAVESVSGSDKIVMDHVAEYITTSGTQDHEAMRDWVDDENPCILLIEGEEEDSDYLSGVSKLSSRVITGFETQEVLLLNWFCGLHTEEDGVGVMARNLLGQLLEKGTLRVPNGDPPEHCDDLVELLCSCIEQQLRETTIVCVLDSLHRYSNVDKLLNPLVQCVEDARRHPFKLMLTSTSSLRDEVDVPDEISYRVTIPERVVQESRSMAERSLAE